MKKAAIYCRVSKDDMQPKHQELFLIKYCVNNNIEMYKVYTDFITGKKTSRPELNNMLNDMRQGLFNCIVCYKVGRLGRSTKHLLNIAEECYNKNIGLIFATQQIDTTTPAGKMFFTILAAFAEFETELISERTKLALQSAKNVGKRGKDKRPRNKSGYYERHLKKKGGMKNA